VAWTQEGYRGDGTWNRWVSMARVEADGLGASAATPLNDGTTMTSRATDPALALRADGRVQAVWSQDGLPGLTGAEVLGRTMAQAAVTENAAVGTVVGTAAGQDADAGDTLVYSLVDDAGGLYAIDAATGVLTVAGAIDRETSARHTITVRVTDAGGLGRDATFTLEVRDDNEGPAASAPGAVSTPQDVALTFSAATGRAFTLSDPDNAWVQVILQATQGTLTLAGTTGLVFGTGDGTDDAQIAFTATAADAQAALDGLVFTPAAGATGAAQILFEVNDGGATGAGDPEQRVQQTVPITLVADPVAPVLDTVALTVREGATVTLTGADIAATDPDSPALTFTVSGLTGGRFELASAPGVAVTGFTLAQLGAGEVRFVHDGGEAAPAFSLTADDGLLASATVAATVAWTPVDDAPTATGGTVTTPEDTARVLAWADFGVADVDSPVSATTAVRITALPGAGTLEISNGLVWTPVTLGQTITRADIDAGWLRHQPPAEASGAALASIGYRPVQTLAVVNPGADAGSAYAENTGDVSTPGWIAVGSAYTSNLTDATFPGDHDQVFALTQGESLTQTLAAAFDAGLDYRLSVDIGWSAAWPSPGFSVEFWAGATRIGMLDPSSVTAVMSTFVTATLDVSGAAWAALDGQPLAIRLAETSAGANAVMYDNVVLTTVPGGEGAAATLTIDVTPANDAPVVILGGMGGGYVENGAPVRDASMTITDLDSADFAGGTLVFEVADQGTATEELSIRAVGTGAGQIGVSGADITYGGTVIGTWTGPGTGLSPLVVTFNAQATAEAVQALGRELTWRDTSDQPSTATRTLRVTVSDGDGGTSVPATATMTVTAVNDAPVITSGGGLPVAITIAENTTAVTTVTATDPDGPSLVFSIAGGADAARFTIDPATGALAFAVAPDFEAPADVGADQVYDVTVQVSDGSATATQALSVTVTDAPGRLTVTTTADVVDGDVSSVEALWASRGADGHISLREAILAANATANVGGVPDRIDFSIAEARVGGAHTLTLASALPALTEAVVLDASTEPDAAVGAPVVVLDGGGAISAGLDIRADDVTVRGLVIHGFSGQAILVGSGAGGTRIAGNHIGTDAAGLAAAPGNGAWGLDIVDAGPGIVVGGTTAADRNVFGGLTGLGAIAINGTSGVVVTGNHIGVGADGVTAVGNATGIVLVNLATGVRIGGTAAGEGNVIAHHLGSAIGVGSAGVEVAVLGNLIHDYGAQGIDLGWDGIVAPNDAGDADTGPNRLQNFPVLASAVAMPAGLAVTGQLDGPSGQVFRIEFFAAPAADATGHGQAVTYLGALDVTTDAAGVAAIATTLAASVPAGQVVTATATAQVGGVPAVTSEFAASVTVRPEPGQVIVTPVSAVTTEAGGTATFTVVLDRAPTADVVIDLASGDPGEGTPSTTRLTFTAADWQIARTVTVTGVDDAWADGDVAYTLVTGAAVSADAAFAGVAVDDVALVNRDDDAVHTIVVDTASDTLDGDTASIAALMADRGADGRISLREAMLAALATANAPGGADRIVFDIPEAVTGGAHTIALTAALPDITSALTLDGTTEPDRTGAQPVVELDFAAAGVADGLVVRADGVTVRGLAILHAAMDGIAVLGGTGGLFELNHIGTTASGSTGAGQGDDGIDIRGGTHVIRDNVISGQAAAGIHLAAGSGSTITGNRIGTSADGLSAIGNFAEGILIDGTAAGATLDGNVIAGNVGAGIVLRGAAVSGHVITGNLIGLAADGSTVLPNFQDGIRLAGGAHDNRIGGVAAGEGNRLAGNVGAGVRLDADAGVRNAILSNQIGAQGAAAIELPGAVGLDGNDALDADTGANDLLNHPVLSSVHVAGGSATIQGTYAGPPSTTVRIEIFQGSARTLVHAFEVTTSAGGSVTYSLAVSGTGLAVGDAVTATATVVSAPGVYGSTSEYAAPVTAIVLPQSAPTWSFLSGSVTHQEGAGPSVLAPAATVSDPDSPDFDGGRLVVSIVGNGQTEDRLVVSPQGLAAGEIGLSGSVVSFGGVAIGTVSGGQDSVTPLTIVLNASADAGAVQALLRRIAFDVASEAPVAGSRTLSAYLEDGDGGRTVVTTGTVTVVPVNDAPTVVTPLADQAVAEDGAFRFVVPAGTFADVDAGEVLTLSTDALPAWLSFDAATGTFTGTPGNADVGAVSVTVRATDAAGASAQSTFVLTVGNVNDAPTLVTPLADQAVAQDVAFRFVVPAGTFADVDAGEVLTLSTDALPAWLSFDAATATFTGTPGNADVGAVSVTVRATDAAGASAQSTFVLTVSNVNDAPT
ncbi:MAG: hypothetical protein RL456_2136, partial [Pseudomonadota bacterium]